MTACQLAPESNQTSRMSISLRKSELPQLAHFVPDGRSCSASCVCHALMPSFSNSDTMLWLTAAFLSGVWHWLQRNTAMGTPQMRWREMHQSGRVAIMLEMRSSPHDGSHLTEFLISSRAS